jgi:hypothetical protein
MNGTIFEKKEINWTQNVRFDFLYNFEIFPIIRITQRDIIINAHKPSYKVPIILVRF